jgi:hypothetical protein
MLEQRSATEHELIKKAWSDENFKNELVTNPKPLLAKEMGLESLPDSVTVKVLEEEENTLYFVLPKNPGTIDEIESDANLDEELSEKALEGVAGGDNYIATGYSDVLKVYKTSLPSSFLYGSKILTSAKTMDSLTQLRR